MFLRGKKSKFTDVEGYNRISRLIEDRQRDLGEGETDGEDLDEEAVLLSREPVVRERSGGRAAEQRKAGQGQNAPEEQAMGAQGAQGPAAAQEERRIPFQPAGADSRLAPTQAFEPPAPSMPVPDIAAPGIQGSLVAADAVWEGKLVTDGNVRVEGTVHGEVQTTGTLFVAANAHIDGTVQARNILLAGEVEGQIHVNERLEILPGGSARGEIQTGSLVVHEGAFIDSRFQMRQAEATTRR